jgi:serine/threonine protein kinase
VRRILADMKHDASSEAFETSKELTGAGSSGWRTFQARVADPVHPDLEGLASGNDCVVKLLAVSRQPDAERIWHDARLLAALPRHPHVVQYYGAILEHQRAGDAVLVASEWCTEGSLLDLLDDGLESARGTKRASDGCIALDVAVEVFIHVCAVCFRASSAVQCPCYPTKCACCALQGLHFLHVDVLLAHGNLRPANILITRTNVASRLQVVCGFCPC